MKINKNITRIFEEDKSVTNFLRLIPDEMINIHNITGKTILSPEKLWSKAQKNNEAIKELISK